MTGLIVLALALVATAVVTLAMRWKNGRFATVAPVAAGDASPGGVASVERISADTIGSPLGERATLLQFSSAFCSPCRATRVLLTDVAATVPGVVAVDIDAEEHLQLVRELGILRTPTVLVLDAEGVVTTRASGLPRRQQVLAALDRAVPDGK